MIMENIIEERVESDGKLRRKYIYKFDNNANLTNEKENIYFQKDKEESEKFYKYDKKGNKIQSKKFFSSGGYPLIKTYK